MPEVPIELSITSEDDSERVSSLSQALLKTRDGRLREVDYSALFPRLQKKTRKVNPWSRPPRTFGGRLWLNHHLKIRGVLSLKYK